jgi:predicted amidohydrolase YtcJ
VIKQLQDTLKAYVDEHRDAKVIRGLGWDRTWFSGGLQGIVRPFTRHDVDVIVPDRPAVLMSYCGHRVLLNTKALEAAGITKDTDDQNGLIVREADGNPSGYIKEPAVYLPIIDSIPGYDFSPKEHRDCLKQCFDMFNRTGHTLLQTSATFPENGIEVFLCWQSVVDPRDCTIEHFLKSALTKVGI